MPSVKHYSTMTEATGLIFLLFNVVSVQEVPFDIVQYVNAFFMVSSFVSHFLTVKVLIWWWLLIMEIVCNFHNGNFYCRSFYK